jgi:hypothetical protein
MKVKLVLAQKTEFHKGYHFFNPNIVSIKNIKSQRMLLTGNKFLKGISNERYNT